MDAEFVLQKNRVSLFAHPRAQGHMIANPIAGTSISGHGRRQINH